MSQTLDVLYADRHLLVAEKPCGLLTQPNETSDLSALSLAKKWLEEHPEIAFSSYLTPVFRLDRAASGLLLFARSSKAAARLQGQKKCYILQKSYLALVEGAPSDEGLFEDWMVHGDHLAMAAPEGQGKYSLLAFQVVAKSNHSTLVEIDLLTGRYHQIRFQFSKRGFPILGDKKYGSSKPFENGIALMHNRLTLIHPVSGEIYIFNSRNERNFFSS